MPVKKSQPELKSFIKILVRDAFECTSNLHILEIMARTVHKYNITHGGCDRVLYDRLAYNAQSSAMISLSRLLDEGKDAISVKKLHSDQDFRQPSNARMLRRSLSSDIEKRLQTWRNNLLAHSLSQQTSSNIPQDFPLTPRDIGNELSTCIQMIRAYAFENKIQADGLPPKFDHDSDFIWPEVELMVCGIFSVKPE